LSFFNRFRRPKAQLTLGVDKNQLFFGDEMKGAVNLKSQEDFEVEQITVSLLCAESVKKIRKYQETIRVRRDEFDFEPKKKISLARRRILRLCNTLFR
jgi:hypothetical protein